MKIKPFTAKVRAWRQAVIERLRASGDWCGHPGPWELDCIEPRGHWHHITGSYQRVKFYEREARDGNLQVLCIECHKAKSRRDQVEQRRIREMQHDHHVRARALHIWRRFLAAMDEAEMGRESGVITPADLK